jgi:multidrug efflux pump subunit AcrA (membrane-fusion protein)
MRQKLRGGAPGARMLVCMLVASLLAAGCSLLPREPEDEAPVLTAPVRSEKAVYAVGRGDVTEQITLRALVAPARLEELYYRTAGRVAALHVGPGDQVSEGQLLAELHAEDIAHPYALAEIEYEKARLTLDAARKGTQPQSSADMEIRWAELELQQAAAEYGKWRTERDRGVPNVEAQTAQAEIAYEMATLEMEEARRRADQLGGGTGPDSGVRLAELDLHRAELELRRWRAALDGARIYAPFAGQVMASQLKPGAMAEAFQPVLTLASPTDLIIEADVDDAALARIAVGQSVRVEFGALAEITQGTVVQLPEPAPPAPTGSTQPKRIRVRPLAPLTGARMGMVGKVRVVLQERTGVLLLPNAAIRQFGNRTYVLLKEPRREVDVVLGVQGELETEILRGLQEGDEVIGR